ncbi:hypothetical protein VPH35_056160 [Triticum aestivum]
MVDAVAAVTKIVDIALKIKKAADTVKQNEHACKQMKGRVEILSTTLLALAALADILGEALKLVTDCQEEDTNFLCLFYNAGKLSQELIKVEQHISNKTMDATLAIIAYLLPKPIGPVFPPTAQQV